MLKPSAFYKAISNYCQQHNGEKCGGRTQISYETKCLTAKVGPNEKFKDIHEFLSSFPPLDFYFTGDALYKWFPEDYFYANNAEGEYCVGMEYYEGRLILGGIFMRHYDIYFNKPKSILHFTRSKCNTEDHVTIFEHFQNSAKSRERPPVTQKETSGKRNTVYPSTSTVHHSGKVSG